MDDLNNIVPSMSNLQVKQGPNGHHDSKQDGEQSDDQQSGPQSGEQSGHSDGIFSPNIEPVPPRLLLDEIWQLIRRFDGYPTRLNLSMPSLLHNSIIVDLEKEILVQNTYPEIAFGGSATISLDGGRQALQPDMQFLSSSDLVPRAIIEITCSQDERRLEDLAHAYLAKSDAQIKRVFGISVGKGRPSTVSEWTSLITPSHDPEFALDLRVTRISQLV